MNKKTVLFIILHWFVVGAFSQVKLYVAVEGNDAYPGTIVKPFKTPAAAINKALSYTGKQVTIELRGGVYELNDAITINTNDYSLQSLIICGYANEKVTFSGAKKIAPQWQPYKNGIVKAVLDLDVAPDRIFINGRSMSMARYPNYNAAARNYNGTAADAISEERVKTWKDPAGGFIHALHSGEWGDLHYRITGKDADGKLQYEGGWQNNRPSAMHRKHRFVENIFEELDAPGEWFYDSQTKTLYLYPPQGTNLQTAQCTVGQLTELVKIIGSNTKPIKNITISNMLFTQSNRSFMLTKEPLLRSDWRIYRGGAILLEGTENINIKNCTFYELGGNAIFLSNYNKNDHISDNHIYDIGGNAIAFVGSANAVRSPAFQYGLFVPWNEMDYTPGPKTNEYPQYCFAEGNLVHNIGTIEKQVAGVEIAMAAHITVSHNSIYTVPRSGINIGDGCWGGHILEFNDVFNTVLETGDHGAFNSWGRDRYWSSDMNIIDSIVAAKPGIELLDVIDPVIMRNNRFQCDHGWDIDLDDGSSNYKIYNNVCLSGGLKLREGYHRIVTNNILINNTLHPHVWLKNSGDVFMYNIVTIPYAPIRMNNWGDKLDSNFFLIKEGLVKAQQLYKMDENSASGNALFDDPGKGNYKVSTASVALKVGFKNFDENVGVVLPALKRIAQRPVINPLLTKFREAKSEHAVWLGAKVKNIESLGEQSAAGLHDMNGVLFAEIPVSSMAAKNKLKQGDVIVKIGDQDINSITDLLSVFQAIKWIGGAECTIIRNQAEQKINISFDKE